MARIEPPSGGGGAEPSISEVDCLTANQVGHWVYTAGPIIAGRIQVDTVDPNDPSKLPAFGLLIEKLTSTEGRVQWGGKVDGVVTGLVPGGVIYLGDTGFSSQVPHPSCAQPVGVAVGEDSVLVAPDWFDIPTPVYASHLGTSDGATNGSILWPGTQSGRVSEPSSPGSPFYSFSKDGDWANPSAEHPGTRLSSNSTGTGGEITELNVGTTLRVRFLRYVVSGGGEASLGEESIACDGTDQVSSPNGWISTSGVHYNAGRYEGQLNLNIPISTLLPAGGYMRILVTHEGTSLGTLTEEFEVFVDTPFATPPLPTLTSVSENTPVLKYLSGIRFYKAGTIFDVNGADNDLFRAMYSAQPIRVDLSGLAVAGSEQLIAYNSAAIIPSHPPTPVYDDPASWSIEATVNATLRSLDGKARHRAGDPFGLSSYNYSSSGPIMIDNVGPTSAETDERFDDEDYRLNPRAVWVAAPTVPPSGVDQWDSQMVLDNSNLGAQVYNGQLIYPVTNFTTPATRRPAQQPGTNYSTMTGIRTYHRVFRHDTTPGTRSNVVMYLPGFDCTNGDLNPGGSGDLNIFIQIPGVSSVWFDCGRDFFSAQFPSPEPGCLVRSLSGVAGGFPSNDYWYFTFGPFSTTPSDRVIVVRVDFRTSVALSVSRIRAHNWT